MPDPFPIELPPGVVKSESKLASFGRYVDCDKVRWVRGKAQKMGGYSELTATAMTGTIRALRGWSDGTARQLIAAASEVKLYAVPTTDYTAIDITPFISTGSLTNKITTTSGSAVVNIELTSHGAQQIGQHVYVDGPVTINGVDLDGDYTIVEIVDADNFTITGDSNATSTGTGGTSVSVSVEITPGVVSPSPGFGWGSGTWGTGTWGTPRTVSGITFDIRSWSLDHFGRVLLAAFRGGPLYKWDPITDAAARATKVTDSPYYPTLMNGFCVTAERIVVAWGTDSASAGTQDLMEVWTSGQGDYTDWDYTAKASATGSPSTVSRLQIGKQVMGGAALGGNITLLWTDAALYLKQYTGSALVFNTRLVSDKAGLYSPFSFCILDGGAFWAAPGAFYMYKQGVQKIPNSDDMAEWIFARLRNRYEVKTFCWPNVRFGEIWWMFVTDDNIEPDTYVVCNYENGYCWYHGTVSRTAQTKLADDTHPILAATDGKLYQHEDGLNEADGSGIAWRLKSAPIQIGQGYRWTDTEQIALDMQRQTGDITWTFTAYEGTPANPTALETLTLTSAPEDADIWPRLTGTQIKFEMSGSGVDCDFRMGVPRAMVQDGGGR